MDKSELRNLYRIKRRNLDNDYRASAQNIIINKLIDYFDKQPQSIISSFNSIKSEIDLNKFHNYVKNSHHKLVIPLMQGNTMHFVDEIGKVHIPQFCIMPCICYDSLGNRIGYGFGYYDRYLENKPNIFKIISNFSQLQCDGNIDSDPWDVRADMIITEL